MLIYYSVPTLQLMYKLYQDVQWERLLLPCNAFFCHREAVVHCTALSEDSLIRDEKYKMYSIEW